MKVYLAGAETCYAGYGFIPRDEASIFSTYFYRDQATKLLEKTSADVRTGLITIDSGAHSFFHAAGFSCVAGQSKNAKNVSPDEYIEGYFRWVEMVYDRIDYFVELDLQDIVGLDKVKQWRQEWKRRGLFDKCITVMHSCDTWRDFEELVDTSESRYIGLEGYRQKKLRLPLMKCAQYCYDRQVKTHCFAMTSSKIMRDYPFYSVDSSTWTTAQRYGMVQVFDKGEMKSYRRDEQLHKRAIVPPALGVNIRGNLFGRPGLEFVTDEFLKMERYFTNLWTERGIIWTQ